MEENNNTGNKQISFRPNPRTTERLDRMAEVRRPMDTWVNGRPDLISTRADLITEYCIEGLRRDEQFLDFMQQQAQEDHEAAIEAMEEETTQLV